MSLKVEPPNLPAPWRSLLEEVDQRCSRSVALHCLGGFVMVACYYAPRFTEDLDYVAVIPGDEAGWLEELAGVGSALARKHKFYLQHVGVVDLPEDYDSRLKEMFAGSFRHLRLWALDPYDLVLSKLTRNSRKDREDVVFLMTSLLLDAASLLDRYRKELRPYLANEERHDLTLKLWLEQMEESRKRPGWEGS